MSRKETHLFCFLLFYTVLYNILFLLHITFTNKLPFNYLIILIKIIRLKPFEGKPSLRRVISVIYVKVKIIGEEISFSVYLSFLIKINVGIYLE